MSGPIRACECPATMLPSSRTSPMWMQRTSGSRGSAQPKVTSACCCGARVPVMKKNTLIAALLVAVLGFSLASAASAQVTTATIVGTITDSSGAALPGATVTARNVDTGFNRTAPSNEDGAYRLEFLPIGNYTLEFTL